MIITCSGSSRRRETDCIRLNKARVGWRACVVESRPFGPIVLRAPALPYLPRRSSRLPRWRGLRRPCPKSPNPAPQAAARRRSVPGFWDPRRRPERPDTSRLTLIRFMSEVDYPPFNFAGPDGNPAGFNVDLARMICEELKVNCTVQMRRFDTLFDALNDNRGDAAIASIAVSEQTRQRVDFTDPYYRPTARFVGPSRRPLRGVYAGKAGGQEGRAWWRVPRMSSTCACCLPRLDLRTYRDSEAAREALRRGNVDLLFGDGFALSFWLNGASSGELLPVRRRPVRRKPLFRRGHRHRRQARQRHASACFNWALYRIWETGRFTDLWLRYFPISPF